MVLLTLSLLLAAEPPPELKIAAPGLTTSGLEASFAAPLTEHLAQAFTGIRVISPRDISVILGLERQRQLLGCAEDQGSCMAELGNALGVEGVLVGDIVKLGKAVQINARIIDPVAGRELATASARVESEAEVFAALTGVGRKLRAQFLTALGRAPGPEAVEAVSTGGSRRFFPVPLAIGGACLAAGLVFLFLSDGAWQRLTSGAPGSLTQAQAVGVARDGQLFQVLGATLVTVGVAAAVGGFGLLLFGSPPGGAQPSASLGLAPNGVVVAGSF
ncbi:MAG: hypothetical protein H6Q89_3955 [Myxococcaceae bacterium]|nr:hypothetical protein [Myxococcaceae bacterium]